MTSSAVATPLLVAIELRGLPAHNKLPSLCSAIWSRPFNMLRLSCIERKCPEGEARLLDVSTERMPCDWLVEGLSWPGVDGGVGLPATASM